MAPKKYEEVPVEMLRWRCNPDSLGFKTTDKIEGCDEIIGQERAVRAMKLGLEVKSPGYNIYVAGLTGTGKTTTVKHLLESIDTDHEIPDDICYVHNFAHEDAPIAIFLPAGKGSAFAQDMEELVQDLKTKLPQIFESEEYQKRSKGIIDKLKSNSLSLFKELEQEIRDEGFAVVKVEMGSVSRPEILPFVNEEVISWDKLNEKVQKGELSEKEFEKLIQKHTELSEKLERTLRRNRSIEKDTEKELDKLKQEVCLPVVSSLIDDLREKYDFEGVTDYLDKVQENVLDQVERFKEKDESGSAGGQAVLGMPVAQPPDHFTEYKVNVIVDNKELDKAPVIIETVPNYRNLFGTIERVWDRSGAAQTDFTRIKAGSLLRANGGYLVLNLLDAITEPGVWVGLKRTLKSRKLAVQSYDPFYFYATTALKPEPVDIDVKVVIVGDSHIYQLLYFYDEDFKKIFKVKAEFDSVMRRDDDAIRNYARLIKKICDDENLRPLSSSGVAQIIEHGVRLAGRQNKLSTRFSDIADVLREAQYWASDSGDKLISDEHVRRAIAEKKTPRQPGRGQNAGDDRRKHFAAGHRRREGGAGQWLVSLQSR